MQGLIIAPKIAEVSSSALKFIKSENPEAAKIAERMEQKVAADKAHEYLSPTKLMPDPADIKPEENHLIDYFG